MLPEYFVYVSAGIFLLGSIGYIRDTLKGTVKPNRVTWLLWFLIPLLIFSAQLGEGVSVRQALLTFMASLVPFLVLLASFMNKQSYWRIGRLDLTCGVLSFIGLVLWMVTGTGLVAILLSLLADFLAGLPTFIKSYRYPETENWQLFLAQAISALLMLLTIQHWNVETYSFPLYLFGAAIVLVVFIKFRLGKR